MSERTYVFIDGEYLRQRHREAMQAFFGVDGELDLAPIMKETGADRAYFYDAIDYARRTNETEQEWLRRVALREEFFSSIRSVAGFHVRPGSVRSGKKREQKEIDVLLAVDMLTLGFTGEMKKAVLVAGDIDFRPVVEELVRHGVFVEVWFHSSSFARELPDAADYGRVIRFRDLYSWNTRAFTTAHPIPYEGPQMGEAYGDLVKAGSIGNYRVELRRHHQIGAPPQPLSFWLFVEPGQMQRIAHEDENFIERYVAAQYGPIEWEARGEEIRVAGTGR